MHDRLIWVGPCDRNAVWQGLHSHITMVEAATREAASYSIISSTDWGLSRHSTYLVDVHPGHVANTLASEPL